MSNQHANPINAGEGKTGLYANRTRSQVPIKPSLFGNSQNLPKKPKVIKVVSKERGQLIDPWSGLAGPPGQPIQPLPWPAHFKASNPPRVQKTQVPILSQHHRLRNRVNQSSARKNSMPVDLIKEAVEEIRIIKSPVRKDQVPLMLQNKTVI